MQVARSGNLLAVICTVMIQLRFPFYVFNFSRSLLKLLTHIILRLQVANLVANYYFTTPQKIYKVLNDPIFIDSAILQPTLHPINKTGTSQVGSLSKTRQYSRNNCWKHLGKSSVFQTTMW